MTKTFERSTTSPWFIFIPGETFGVDLTVFATEFWAKTKFIIRNTSEERLLDALKTLVQKVIDDSIRYKDKDVTNPPKRFQIMVNGNILEIYLLAADVFGLIRKSDSKWLITGTYESGTDFISQNGKNIEAKVYFSEKSMTEKIEAANQGDRYIFHDADVVCCYLINTTRFIANKPYHYQWLKRIEGQYVLYNDESLDNLTQESMPERLPLCRCSEDPTTGDWQIEPFYRY